MKNKSFLIFLTIFLTLIFFCNTGSYATSSSNLIINNEKSNIYINQEFNGDYFLPLRDVVTKLGGQVSYDYKNSTIIFSLKDQDFSYSINDNLMEYKIDNSTKGFNNHFDIKLKDGKSYISLDFLSSFFGISFDKVNESLFISSNKDLSNNFIIKPLLVPHGGGNVHGIPISNSLESINNSIENGSRLIELDFLKTTDNKFVLGHDWSVTYRIFKNGYGIMNYEQYIKKNSDLFTPLGMDDLINILDDHKYLSIITDTEDDNKEFLEYIVYNYRSYMNRFKVQVYSINEYHFAKSLGFKNIIYSMYKVYLTDDQIFSFAKNNDVFAITMDESRTLSGLAKRLSEINVMTYAHTVNDLDLINKYVKLGAGGFYTDIIY